MYIVEHGKAMLVVVELPAIIDIATIATQEEPIARMLVAPKTYRF